MGIWLSVSTTQTKAQDSVFVLLPALPSLDSSSLSKRFQSKKDISVGGEGHLRFSTSTKRQEIFNYSWLSFLLQILLEEVSTLMHFANFSFFECLPTQKFGLHKGQQGR